MLSKEINCLINREDIDRVTCRKLVLIMLSLAEKIGLSDEDKSVLIELSKKLDKNINYVSGLSTFMQSWDYSKAIFETNAEIFHKSLHGNINNDGTEVCMTAAVLIASHPKFEDSLEEGVKELVLALIQEFNCITCSSCQGHFSIENTMPMRERTVEIIPRNDVEYNELLFKLKELADKANLQVDQNAVKLMILENILESEHICTPCLRIIFKSQSQNEEQYFQETESLYKKYVELILQC